MEPLRLSFASDPYDHLFLLRDGTVRPQGIELNHLTLHSLERHHQMIRHGAYDVCELSMSAYLICRERGCSFTAIPVFLRRMFFHRYMYCRRDSSLSTPADLAGKRVGIYVYQMTLALWIRGYLQEQYGIDPGSIHWYTSHEEPFPIEIPAGVTVERIPAGASLEEKLLAGELDALFLPDVIASLRGASPGARRLVQDYSAAEADYFRSTGHFPVMHVIVVRDEILERHPWVALSLLRAFRRCRRQWIDFMEEPSRMTGVWELLALETQKRLMGRNPWGYSLKESRATIERMIRDALAQGLLRQPLEADALFFETTREA